MKSKSASVRNSRPRTLLKFSACRLYDYVITEKISTDRSGFYGRGPSGILDMEVMDYSSTRKSGTIDEGLIAVASLFIVSPSETQIIEP